MVKYFYGEMRFKKKKKHFLVVFGDTDGLSLLTDKAKQIMNQLQQNQFMIKRNQT